ncbi:MAG: EamA family transporter [Betaproteobacteria bacterium]|nr:EamA family transporter [Betaproteobacteria bacterium]
MTALSAPIPLAFIAAILFGLAIVAAQLGVRAVPTLPGAVVANASAALFFWLAAPWFWTAAGFSATALSLFALVGLFFPATVTLLMLEGNRRLGPSLTASISGTTPLFTYIAAVALLGETLALRGLLGTLVIVVGIAVLSGRGGVRDAHRLFSSRSVAFPLASAVIRAVAQILVAFGMLLWPSPYAATLVAYTTSTVVVALILFLRGDAIPARMALGWFAASGLMNGVGLVAMYAAFQHGEVSVVAPIVATAPLVTLGVHVALMRAERVTPRLLTGVALTALGVILILLR